MKPLLTAGAVVAAALLLSGCILRDETTTITIAPDGSASVVVVHSNIRSTQEGERGEEALRQYAEDFDAGRSDLFVRVGEAGGEVAESRWLRRDAPYSTVVVASLPDSGALEAFGSVRGGASDFRVGTRYAATGARRRLTMDVSPPEGLRIPASPVQTQVDRANGFSEFRIAVESGRIVAAKGWTVAADGRSALLSIEEVAGLLREAPDQIELFLEWDVALP